MDRAQVLATPGMDQHSSYVALSRHRESVSLHCGKDDFAERRGISCRDRIAEIACKVPEKVRGLFDGLRVQQAPAPEADRQVRAQAAVRRQARAVSTLFLAQEDGTSLDNLNAQGRYAPMREEIVEARKELNAFGANYSRDIERAYQVDPPLAHEATGGQVRRAVLAMKAEQVIREAIL